MPERSNAICDLIGLSRNCSSIARSSEVFRGVERKSGCSSERAHRITFVSSRDCLRSILDHDHLVSFRSLENWSHVRGMPVQMHRYDGLAFLCNSFESFG